jgi:hypothetical protein
MHLSDAIKQLVPENDPYFRVQVCILCGQSQTTQLLAHMCDVGHIADTLNMHNVQVGVSFNANAINPVTFDLNAVELRHRVNGGSMYGNSYQALLDLCEDYPGLVTIFFGEDSLQRYCFAADGTVETVIEVDDGAC